MPRDDPIDYSFLVTNDGNVTLTGVGVTDGAVGLVSCSVTTLAPGASTTCTAATYLTAQAQVDAGSVVNTADASGTPPIGAATTDSDTLTITAIAAPSITIVKSADVTTVNAENDPINYSFLVTNDGNVTLTGVGVTDGAVGAVSCPVTTLAPGAFTTCVASAAYLTTQAQVDGGSVVNLASASGTPPVGAAVTDSDTLTITAIAAPSIAIVKSADVTTVNAENDPINYSFLVTNDGNVTLTGVGVTDVAVGAVSCPVTTLAPGAFTTCVASAAYLTTQPQVDAGSVINTADASGAPPVGAAVTDSDTLTITATAAPSIAIVKSADVTTVNAENDPINYSFLVTNDGNVTLTSVGVTDGAVGNVTCPVTTLAPGDSTTCTADNLYLTTQVQVDGGSVVNLASASGTPPVGAAVTDSDTLTITAIAAPSITIVKSADVTTVNAENDPINYSFLVTNDGNVTLTGVGVTDGAVGAVSCPVTTLAPGAFTTCVASAAYLTTQPQVDAGSVINTADATGTPPVGAAVTDSDTLTITATAAPSITIVKSADVTTVNAENDPINYSFLVTNDGNVTLTSVGVTDVAVGSVTCPVTTLAPGASTTCTAASYLTTQAQVDAGSVVNAADASGTPPVGAAVTDTDTLTITATPAPSVDIVKSADVTTVNAENDPITYSFLVTNDGNVSLNSVGVTDVAVGGVTCPVTTLAPGEFTICTADAAYLTTQLQVDAGSVVNTADASGTPPVGAAVIDSDTLAITATASPSIDITKSADVTTVNAENDPIAYSFLVTNDGNVTLTNVGVTDGAVGPVICPVTTLAPGASTTCVADNPYLTTQDQIDAGSVVNLASTAGTPPVGSAVTDNDTLTITAPAAPDVSIVKSADVTEVNAENDPINYSFLVTNVGNVTLTNVGVTDGAVGTVTCPATTLAPGASTTCTADNAYLATQTQVDAGSVVNTADASGTPPIGAPVTDTDTLTINVPAGPSIAIVKSADVSTVGAENDPIAYSFLVTNDGNVTLTTVGVADVAVGAVTCPVATLAPGASTTCSADNAYLATQPQIDAGSVVNTADASGTPPIGAAVTDSDTLTITATPAPSIDMVKSADVASVSAEDDPINYSFLVTNTGNVTLSSVGVIDGAVGTVTCPVTTLAPGASTTCTADNAYLTTQTQVDAGSVLNTADASGTPPVGAAVTDSDTLGITVPAGAAISITKSADVASVNAEDDPINYSFVVTNVGNVTLTNVGVTDGAVGTVTCPVTTLLPGEFTTCTADNAYLTTQPQVDAGSVVNTADASGTPPVGAAVTETDTLTIAAPPSPNIDIVKSADVTEVNAEGDPISYSFVVTNIGNVTLTNVGVSDGAVGAVTCPVTTLAPGEFTTCTADNAYLTTQPQVDAGSVINTADASGTPPVGAAISDSDTLTIAASAAPSIAIVKSADVTEVNALDDPISYSFVVTNDGNVTLTNVGVTDGAVGAVTCPVTTLAPGEFTTCSADNAYLTTQPQVDAGSVVNIASVAGTPPTGPATTDSDSLTIVVPSAPSIDIVKSADVSSVSAEDDPINYSFLVTNDGNVTLSAVAVTDVAVGAVSCPMATLAPGDSTTCTADNPYLTTQPQIDAGEVVNVAEVTGTPPTGSAVTDQSTLTISASNTPSITLAKTADVVSVSAEDDPINYSFLVTNSGNVTLTGVAVTDLAVGTVTCPVTTLAPGAFTTCTADAVYLATQPQIDAGQVVNNASVSGQPPTGTAVTALGGLIVPAQSAPSIDIAKSANVTEVNAEDDPINYSFLVTNDGNVTLATVDVADVAVGTVTCPVTTLAPGEFTTCTADNPYLTTQPQVDAGGVDNVVSVQGTPLIGAAVDATDVLTVPANSLPNIDIVKSANVSTVANEDDPILYSFLVTNSGNVTLTTVGVTDAAVGNVTCPVTTLAPGEFTTCTADDPYLTTQPQIDAGSVVNIANVVGSPPTGPNATDSSTLTVTAPASPSIDIVKSADVTEVNAEDDPVNYSFLVTNDGNVTLTSVGVVDAAVGAVTCPVTTLAPGEFTTCTADAVYLTAQAQVDAGAVVNTADASGTPPVGDAVIDSDTLTITAPAAASIVIVKSADVTEVNAEDDPVNYSFLVTNDGNVTLTSVGVVDAAVGAVTCPVTTLAPGEFTTCTADAVYLTAQAQVDAGAVVNTADASGTPPVGDAVIDSDTLTINVPIDGSIVIVKSADVTEVNAEDDPVNYSFLVTNDGNVTLTSVGVVDAAVGAVTCPVTTLAPGEFTTCTADATYLTAEAQVDAGAVVNTADASGTPPVGDAVIDSDTLTITAPAAASIVIVKSADVTEVNAEDDPVNYSFLVTNDGNVTLTNVGVIDGAVGAVTCPVTTLAPGGFTTCTADATYLTTQPQLDAGSVVNLASAAGTPPIGTAVQDNDTLTIPAISAPSIDMVKSADVAAVNAEDDPVNYSFLVTNDGNVTLTLVGVTDAAVGTVTCPVTTLAPSAFTTCVADAAYLTTQVQIDAGSVVNTAGVSGTPPVGDTVIDSDTLTITATPTPSIDIVKSADVTEVNAENDPINYSFLVTNDGNVTLTNVGVTDVAVGTVTCPVTTLGPGASTTCTADAAYLTTQAQVDAGSVVNTADVSGTPPVGVPVVDTDTLTITAPAAASIVIVKSADVTTVAAEDDPINYSFLVTNDGNVTLNAVAVTDVAVGNVTCPVTTLVPGASTTCTADNPFLATQPQIDAGAVDNVASASGTPLVGDAVTDSDTLTIAAPAAASIVIVKSADVTTVAAEDDPINYSFLVTNDGNVTLTAVGVTDVAVGAVTCPVTTLAPGVSTTCSADNAYLATQTQIDAGQVDNTATAAGNPPVGPAVTASDDLTITAPATPEPRDCEVGRCDDRGGRR